MTDEDGAGQDEDRPPVAGQRGTTSDGTENRGIADEQFDTPAADREGEELTTEEDREGNVAGMLAPDQPLEPGTIDLENALFVLLGVVIVVGFLALGIAGL